MHTGTIQPVRRPWPLPPEPRVEGMRPGSAILFGIVAPLVCLVLDPCVFRNSGALAPLGLPLAGAYAVAAYVLVGIAFAALHGDDAALGRAVGRLKPFGWLADAGIPFRSWSPSGMDATSSSRRLHAAWVAAGGAPLEALVD